jgi:hypothetical protein
VSLDQQRLCLVFGACSGKQLPQIEGRRANEIQPSEFFRHIVGLREITANAFEGFLIVDAIRSPNARSLYENGNYAFNVAQLLRRWKPFLLKDAQRLVEIAAGGKDIGDLAHGDGS